MTNQFDLPVYPCADSLEHKGLTMREYFAAAAMQGMLANSANGASLGDIAEDAVRMANTLCQALDVL